MHTRAHGGRVGARVPCRAAEVLSRSLFGLREYPGSVPTSSRPLCTFLQAGHCGPARALSLISGARALLISIQNNKTRVSRAWRQLPRRACGSARPSANEASAFRHSLTAGAGIANGGARRAPALPLRQAWPAVSVRWWAGRIQASEARSAAHAPSFFESSAPSFLSSPGFCGIALSTD